MSTTLPRLYRGDSDLTGTRRLREYWCKDEILMTKLGLHQGDGASVMRDGLSRSIGMHSTLAIWKKTHFLSFSASRAQAEHFLTCGGVLKKMQVGVEDAWTGHLVRFDHSSFENVVDQGNGVYLASWSAPQTVRLPPYTVPIVLRDRVLHEILLVDVAAYLAVACMTHKAPFAAREQEWVLLPLDPMQGPHSNGQLLAQISHTFIDQAEFYAMM